MHVEFPVMGSRLRGNDDEQMNTKLATLITFCAVALTACAGAPIVTQAPPPVSPPLALPAPTQSLPPPATNTNVCADCGTIVHIETIGTGKGQGAVLTGIVGSVVRKSSGGELDYNIFVRLDDGRLVTVRQKELGGLRQNDRVRVVGGKLVPK
jgi:hypothetical protein